MLYEVITLCDPLPRGQALQGGRAGGDRHHRGEGYGDVGQQEAGLGVVAGVAEGHLGQVVGAEREELGYAGHLVGGDTP